MKNLGEFKCPACGWVHSSISEADAIAAVADFNGYFATLSQEALASFGGEPSSLEMYKHCFRCGAPAASFLPAAAGDAPVGCTLQAVIAPTASRRIRSEGSSMRPVVVLDLDDVIALHKEHNSFQVLAAFKNAALDEVPSLWKHLFDASACKNLRTLHDEFVPEYVISSSWTSFLDRAQICEVLRRTGLTFVAENLHRDWCTPREDGSYRLTEIDGWLDMHALGNPLPYVILDDHISGQSLPGSHLEKRTVLCDAWVGFTHPKLRSAQKILRDQLRRHDARTRD